ncbi:MAG: hypothetical protein H6766_00560 [Candidatus Peribacteria bacterium]|nr:MAG: hypothetical protein H6766_00560 [Candidatus Peribacteria bacterium]
MQEFIQIDTNNIPPQLHGVIQNIEKSFINDREKFEELSYEELKILKEKARQETEDLRNNTLRFFYPQTNIQKIRKKATLNYENCQHLYNTWIKPSYNQTRPS